MKCPAQARPVRTQLGRTTTPARIRRIGSRTSKCVSSIRLHDLRHTSATIALAAGVHPKVMQERLGHADISITLDLYSHVTPGMGAEAAAKIGAALYGVSRGA